jgi:prepilin-type N-terminal cleavage/methylation domain-containing protein
MSSVAARGRRPERRGFSLIEVLLSATLLGVGLVGIASAFCFAATESRLSRDQIVGNDLAAALLAEARTQPFTALASWYAYVGDTGTAPLEQTCRTRLGQSGLNNPQAWLTVTNVQTDLKGLSVVITWGAGTRTGRVELATLVSPRF